MRSGKLLEKSHDSSVSDISSRVDLNDLMRKVREEEKKSRRTNVYVSAAAVSALAVFGIFLTL
tara:strand:- start:432 stop:620 length:189 start_codon:yes stop_codon:yes gene_type:complete